MGRKKVAPFSATKAVRANARARVGQPKAARVIPEKPTEGERDGKHKATLADLLARRDE